MDADRRRKTVIAGTFAIAGKSLSNAHPISADEIASHHQVDMIITSMHAPSLHPPLKPALKGFTRALSQHLQQSRKEQRGAVDRGRARGKNRSIEIPAGFRTAPISLQVPGQFFVSVRIFCFP
jgi:hypothetical protein